MKKLFVSILGIIFPIIILLIFSGFFVTKNNAQSSAVKVISETRESAASVATPTSTPIIQPQLIRENPMMVWMQNDRWHR